MPVPLRSYSRKSFAFPAKLRLKAGKFLIGKHLKDAERSPLIMFRSADGFEQDLEYRFQRFGSGHLFHQVGVGSKISETLRACPFNFVKVLQDPFDTN